MASSKKITVKLLVDKEKKRVVFAESDKDFVDILFSFLTLPMGTIIRLLGKQSTVGCIGNLYQSAEDLDPQHLQTEACKTMLLRPLSAAAIPCESLRINIDDTNPRDIYTCHDLYCCSSYRTTNFYSSVPNARCCNCGNPMDCVYMKVAAPVLKGDVDGVFVWGGMQFLISDDLHVMPASTLHSLSLFERLGIRDTSDFEVITLELGPDEVSNLLKRSLISNTPLTDVCFHKEGASDAITKLDAAAWIQIQQKAETDADTESKRLNVKLLMDKGSNKLLYAEVGEDLADLLFSFLTYPLGSVIRLLDKRSAMGCIDNLYRSVDGNDYMKSEGCKSMLLSPKLAPYFGCSSQILKLDEMPPESWNGDKEMNPKSQSGRDEAGGGFVRRPRKFMVTDNLCISILPLVHLHPQRVEGDFQQSTTERGKRGRSTGFGFAESCFVLSNSTERCLSLTERMKADAFLSSIKGSFVLLNLKGICLNMQLCFTFPCFLS